MKKSNIRYWLAGGALLGIVFLCLPFTAQAYSNLLNISDLISTSAPGAYADHTVTFTVFDAVSPGGHIIVVPSAVGQFLIPGTFDISSVDFAVADSPGNFVERNLAATPDVSVDGVSITTGTSGVVTITLASALPGIAAGSQVRLKFGMHASHQAAGTVRIRNPAALGAHPVDIRTETEFGDPLNVGNALIFIISQVTAGAAANIDAEPFRYNGKPAGTVWFSVASAEISLNTNDVATCRYSTFASTTYSEMTGAFTITGGAFHSKTIPNITDATQYRFYVRCVNTLSVENASDYVIEFKTTPPPGPGSETGNTGTSPGGGGGGGGGGGIPQGQPFPSPFAEVTFNGIAYPGSFVSIIKDGKKEIDVPALPTGRFSAQVQGLPKGTYTFVLYGTDSARRVGARYTTTFSLIGGTKNTVGNIFLPPTASLKSDTLLPGEFVVVEGSAAQSSTVEIWFYRQVRVVKESDVIKTVVAADQQGLWRAVIDTKGLPNDTYQLKVRASLSATERSDFGELHYIGLGVKAKPDTGLSADLNRDGKVNLIDFSILLFHWSKVSAALIGIDPTPDINRNGKVDLADFSIMLFQWTG